MNVGSSLFLLCGVASCPTPSIAWSKDGVSLTTSGGMVVMNDGTLTIRRVSRQDSGLYTCTANNSYGDLVLDANVVVTGMR